MDNENILSKEIETMLKSKGLTGNNPSWGKFFVESNEKRENSRYVMITDNILAIHSIKPSEFLRKNNYNITILNTVSKEFVPRNLIIKDTLNVQKLLENGYLTEVSAIEYYEELSNRMLAWVEITKSILNSKSKAHRLT